MPERGRNTEEWSNLEEREHSKTAGLIWWGLLIIKPGIAMDAIGSRIFHETTSKPKCLTLPLSTFYKPFSPSIPKTPINHTLGYPLARKNISPSRFPSFNPHPHPTPLPPPPTPSPTFFPPPPHPPSTPSPLAHPPANTSLGNRHPH